jgi:D-serine deaminase-like pyridoxal phosphate-dependent protein
MLTPSVYVSHDRLQRNIGAMHRQVLQNGCNIRPHIKTHKMPMIAQLQLDAGASGITVAKVSEAEVMARAGIGDIFIAYPVVGRDKLMRVKRLNRKCRLILGVDSPECAEALAGIDGEQSFEVRLEIDTGLKRTGLPPEKALDAARTISRLKNIRLTGIYTFKGLTYRGAFTPDGSLAASEEASIMAEVKAALDRAGLAITEVSAGSTPTAIPASGCAGVTEVRPGTYVFYDYMNVKLGVCTLDDCAAVVRTTVVSIPHDDLIVVDAGSKSICPDIPLKADPYRFESYGYVVQYPHLVLSRLSEEHGMLYVPENTRKPEIGEVISIIPNHICPTINLYDYLYLERDGEVKRIRIDARGKNY